MKNGVRTILLVLGDIGMLAASFFLMLVIRFPANISQSVINGHIFPFMFVFLIWLLVFFLFNLYETKSVKLNIPLLRMIGIASMVALTASTILFYLVPSFGITPKTNLVIFSAIFIFLFLVWRRIFYHIFSSYFKRSVVFITKKDKNEQQVNDLVEHIKVHPQAGFETVGVYGSFYQLLENHKNTYPDVFIVCREVWRDSEDFKKLHNTKKEIWDLAYAYEDILGRIPIDAIDEGWFMHNINSNDKKIYSLGKRILGTLFALIGVLIISPVILIVSLAIKINDGGPVLYFQTRIGKNGKNFKLYKFRSMVVNADHSGAEWTIKNDPRITEIGKIIRKLHIDEIPQLFNVLKGEMTLVGPRPEIPSFAEKLEKEIPFYYLRHTITPGFTGWAQIKFRNARGIEESKEKFEYDLYYIKNRNIFMDFGIIIRTIAIIFTHDS